MDVCARVCVKVKQAAVDEAVRLGSLYFQSTFLSVSIYLVYNIYLLSLEFTTTAETVP
jgi:hypothetical protein